MAPCPISVIKDARQSCAHVVSSLKRWSNEVLTLPQMIFSESGNDSEAKCGRSVSAGPQNHRILLSAASFSFFSPRLTSCNTAGAVLSASPVNLSTAGILAYPGRAAKSPNVGLSDKFLSCSENAVAVFTLLISSFLFPESSQPLAPPWHIPASRCRHPVWNVPVPFVLRIPTCLFWSSP